MAGIFIFSEDGALGKQLLTPALELKQSLSQPITALTVNEADAKELAALGADKALVLQPAGGWTEALSEAIYRLVSGAGASIFLVGGTLRGKHVGAYVAAKLNAGMSTDAKSLKIEGGKLLSHAPALCGLGALCKKNSRCPLSPPYRRARFPPSKRRSKGWCR